MKIYANYLIKPNTVLVAAERSQKGRIYSRVIEGKKTFLVAMSPKTIMDYSLHYYCSSLPGAIEGARSILGNISMPPILISSRLDICWFPCVSAERNDCIWFSLSHVQKTEKLNTKQTKVSLNYGHSIVLDMKRSRFELKRQRASQLSYISSERTNHLL
jgi:competence protein ComK